MVNTCPPFFLFTLSMLCKPVCVSFGHVCFWPKNGCLCSWAKQWFQWRIFLRDQTDVKIVKFPLYTCLIIIIMCGQVYSDLWRSFPGFSRYRILRSGLLFLSRRVLWDCVVCPTSYGLAIFLQGIVENHTPNCSSNLVNDLESLDSYNFLFLSLSLCLAQTYTTEAILLFYMFAHYAGSALCQSLNGLPLLLLSGVNSLYPSQH